MGRPCEHKHIELVENSILRASDSPWLFSRSWKTPRKVNLLTGKLAIEELFKKWQAELNKVRPDGERIVQQFETISVGDARLRTMTQNLEEECRVEALQAKKADSLRKKEYQEGVQKRREEMEVKKPKRQRKNTIEQRDWPR